MSGERSIVHQINDALRTKEQYLQELERTSDPDGALRYQAGVRSIERQVVEDLCLTGIGLVLMRHPVEVDLSNVRFHPTLSVMNAEQIAIHAAARLPMAS